MQDEQAEAQCPVRATVRLLGGKYKSIILWELCGGTMRFSEIQARIPEATGKMLTKQLRELEADGLVSRKVYPVVPPRTEYSLTEFGRTSIPLLRSMIEWGTEYLVRNGIPVAECVETSMPLVGSTEKEGSGCP